MFRTRLPRNPELPASTGLEIHLTQLTLFPDFGLCRGVLHTMTTMKECKHPNTRVINPAMTVKDETSSQQATLRRDLAHWSLFARQRVVAVSTCGSADLKFMDPRGQTG